MTELHSVKIHISEIGRGEVLLDGKPLQTVGTTVTTSVNTLPEIAIYVAAETLEQDVTGNLSIHTVSPVLSIWKYEDAPEAYKRLSNYAWRERDAHVLRYPMFGSCPVPEGFERVLFGLDSQLFMEWKLVDKNDSNEYGTRQTVRYERYKLDNGYGIVIYGGIETTWERVSSDDR